MNTNFYFASIRLQNADPNHVQCLLGHMGPFLVFSSQKLQVLSLILGP